MAWGRSALQVRCAKGFGEQRAPKPDDKPAKVSTKRSRSKDGADPKAVSRALELAERHAQARPVDPKEAARGKVDVVRVKNWGGGEPAELGELQVEAAAAAFDAGGSMPFHEQLARRLETLQAEGALGGGAPKKGATPLPPFERWAFAEAHYLQYLADLHAAHAALEGCVARAAAAAAALGADAPAAALAQFAPQRGLHRSAQVQHDLDNMLSSTSAATSSASSPGSEAGGASNAATAPAPTPAAAAYASYLATLGTRCAAAGDGQELALDAARVLANAYVIHLALLTSGTRVGAAAAERLGLFARQALNTYRTYPPHVGEPLRAFIQGVNQLGPILGDVERDALVAELPRAMVKASGLLAPLAREY